MELTLKKHAISKNVILVEVIGDLGSNNGDILRSYLDEVADSDWTRVVVDMSAVDLMGSAALGALVKLLKRVRQFNGLVAVVGSDNKAVMKIFYMSGLVRVFAFFDDIQRAVDWISQDQPEIAKPGSPSDSSDGSEGHWFSVRAYTSDEAAGAAVEESVRAVFAAFGLDEIYAFPPQIRSWFREFLVRVKDPTGRPTRGELLALLQQTAEQQLLEKRQAEADAAQSQAVASLLAAVEKTPNALVQVGSMILLKAGGTVVVRNLSKADLEKFQRNPTLFHDPERALLELQGPEKHHPVEATLVTVHGFGSSSETWDRLCDVWQSDDELKGLEVHRFGYPSPRKPQLPGSWNRIPDFDDIAQLLDTEYKTKLGRVSNIVFVTHSQGGLILQRFLAWKISEGRARELARIRSIVMIACPNNAGLRTK